MAKKLDINQVHERSESSYIHAPVKSTVFFLIVSEGTKRSPITSARLLVDVDRK